MAAVDRQVASRDQLLYVSVDVLRRLRVAECFLQVLARLRAVPGLRQDIEDRTPVARGAPGVDVTVVQEHAHLEEQLLDPHGVVRIAAAGRGRPGGSVSAGRFVSRDRADNRIEGRDGPPQRILRQRTGDESAS